MSRITDDMDVAGYDRGVVQMPSRLRAYAYGNGSVQLDLNIGGADCTWIQSQLGKRKRAKKGAE